MATRRAQRQSCTIRSDLEDLEELTRANPTQDHSTSIIQLTNDFKKLRTAVEESTIHEDNIIHRDLVQIKSRIHALNSRERESTPTSIMSRTPVAKSRTVQLPKLQLPTFDGNIMNWAHFWAQFRTAVDSNLDLTQEHKLAYLWDAIKDPSIKALLFSGAERDGLYSEVIKTLHQRFDKKRTIHSNYCQKLLELNSVKATKADLHLFIDTVKTALAGLRHTTQDNLPSFLTSMFVPRIPKALQVEWEVHSKDSEGVPPIDDLLTFLGFRADVLSSAATSGKESEASSWPADRKQSQAGGKQTAAVHASTPTPSPSSMPYGYRYECNLCPGLKHPLYQCSLFNEMTIHQRGDYMRSRRICFNCLAPGHNSTDCRSPARCRACGGKHHTLVHRENSNAPVTLQQQPMSQHYCYHSADCQCSLCDYQCSHQ